MKLVVQIPCYNEAETLPQTIRDLPARLEGFEEVEILVIDDGSTDGTAEVAARLGVDHVRRIPRNRGLANAFATGLQTSLELGADVIVNTDGDNQYRGNDIPALLAPILAGQADMVVGDRRVETIAHFSWMKKWLQKLGSWAVRWASGTDVPDSTSGFRALTREAALQLSIYSGYTYTLETIIQAGKKGIVIASVPIHTNPRLRESRLIRNTSVYIASSAATILRIFLMYEALRVFLTLGLIPVLVGGVLLVRFAFFYVQGQGQGHVQSLIFASILVVLGFLTFLLGLLADLIARNRRIEEENSYRLKKMALEQRHPWAEGQERRAG